MPRSRTRASKDVRIYKPIEFQRADPKALSEFDPATKRCTMNCGPHKDDPRSNKERKFLCDDCES